MTAAAPASCEGDVRFTFRRSKLTATGWSIVHVRLEAVQTKGVVFRATEGSDDEDACLRAREPGESAPPGCDEAPRP